MSKTLSHIDLGLVILHVSPIDPSQQVALTHWGLFIDGSLNVPVVLIDPSQSSQAARPLEGGSGAGAEGATELKSH